jgi:hypothetical protein
VPDARRLTDTPAALAGLLQLLERDGDARAEIVADAEIELPDELAGHPQVRRRLTPPSPWELAAWTACLWTPRPGPAALLDVAEAGLAGVPMVADAVVSDRLPRSAQLGALGHARALVDLGAGADAWSAALDAASGRTPDDRAALRAAATALHGPDAARRIAVRFAGWLDRATGTSAVADRRASA